MNRLAAKNAHVSFVMPVELHQRLIRQAGKETTDRGHTVTVSDIVRGAVEDYLDMWETATFVPEPTQPKES